MTAQPVAGWMWRRYLRRRAPWIVLAFVLMAVEGSMLGALSYMVRPMFDRVFVAGEAGAVAWVALAVAGIFALRAVTAFLHRAIMEAVGQHVVAAMQRDMVGHLVTLDSAYFQTNPPGVLIERVRGDTTAASQIWSVVLTAAGRDVVGLLALLAVALSVDWVWTLIAVAGAPVLLGPVAMAQRYVRRRAHDARAAAAVLSTRLDEIFHGIDTIKLNTSEAREARRFAEAAAGFRTREIGSRIGQAAIPAMIDLAAAFGFAGVLVYGGGQIIGGEKTLGEFMSFFTAMGLIFEPLRRLANVSGAWSAARASLERIRGIFLEEAGIVAPARARAAPADPAAADIVFENVTVAYGGEAALSGASFTARAGETTALVGASGAGKSTVFRVLTRLVDAGSGRVTLGGVATTEMGLGDLRGLFSVVTQEAPMFDESLRDNIVLATGGADAARVRAAVEAAHLGAFVDGLPEGLETRVGPRGSLLSGGQRQRVAIARALLRDAPVLLLDEATSALDAESEARVQEALDRLSEGRTTLVIAHRLSTIRRADKIVVMDRGRVIDEGRHEDLLARGGAYARLYELQFAE